MAQQEEPLYDFPEPTEPSARKFLGHQRGRGSLRSISVLDRLLLTVPVWLQLSINPATALHILQREPPGVRTTHTYTQFLSISYMHLVISSVVLQTFLVRKSRTSQRNVLCVRLADDSVPSFVQQFGIREEHSSKAHWWLMKAAYLEHITSHIKMTCFYFKSGVHYFVNLVRLI